MALSTRVIAGSILAAHLIFSGAAMADELTQTNNIGVIVLRDKNNATCTLSVPAAGQTVTYDLSKSGQGECGINTARTIELANLPSATSITLTDYPDCKITNGDFYIELKTTLKQTNVEPLQIEHLTTFKQGAIVKPGLKIISLRLNTGGTARDNLDCVKIVTSATPPAP